MSCGGSCGCEGAEKTKPMNANDLLQRGADPLPAAQLACSPALAGLIAQLEAAGEEQGKWSRQTNLSKDRSYAAGKAAGFYHAAAMARKCQENLPLTYGGPGLCETCRHRADSIAKVARWRAKGAQGMPCDPAPKVECKDHEGYGLSGSRKFCEDYEANLECSHGGPASE